MPEPRTGTREEWHEAREELLRLEQEHTRRGDELMRRGRELPWVKVEEEYRFKADEGRRRWRTVRRLLAAPRLPLHVRPGG